MVPALVTVPAHEVMADSMLGCPPHLIFEPSGQTSSCAFISLSFACHFQVVSDLKKKHIGVFDLCVGVLILAVKFYST